MTQLELALAIYEALDSPAPMAWHCTAPAMLSLESMNEEDLPYIGEDGGF